MGKRTCSIQDCDAPALARGWCRKHYLRWYKKGSFDDERTNARGICSLVDCSNIHAGQGYCQKHLKRWRKHGDPNITLKSHESYHPETCTVEGCVAPYYGRGFCRGHWKRFYRHGDPLAGRRANALSADFREAPLLDRLADALSLEGECFVWRGNLSRGYGRLSVDGKVWQAHVVAYEELVGPVSEGLEIDHLCRNRACINPDHLEPVTHQENMLRGGTVAAYNAAKTHCLRGHELSGANVYVWAKKPNSRSCKECARIRARRKVGG